jgi:hypothetical protein
MFNVHNLDEESDNYMDEIFFFNPNIDKSLRNENNAYFEENLVFPFMFFMLNEELGDFYRPDLYISVIHKIKKNHLYYLNVMFQYKFLCPFDKKMRKNIVFAMNGKDKNSNIFLKDFQKLETEFSAFYNDELLKPYVSKLDSFENVQRDVLSAFNISLEEKLPDIKIIEEGDNDGISKQSSPSRNIEEKKESQIGKEEEKKDSEVTIENKDIVMNNENLPEISDNIEERKIEENKNDNNLHEINEENNQQRPKDDLVNLEIDPQFLQVLPEDLAQEILNQHTRILNSNSNLAINQYYDYSNIDQDFLNELPDEIRNEILSANRVNNIPTTIVNANSNIDHTTFFESLPQEIREEILINAPPDLLNNLPPDLMAEAQMLIERESNSRRLLFSNNRRVPSEGLHFNIGSGEVLFQKNQEEEFIFTPPKYTFEETFATQNNVKDLCNYFTSFFDDEFLENIITFNIKYTCEFTPKNKISTNHNWNLINNLMQNSSLRYKILDILFVVWIVDSICLKELIKLNPNIINQNSLLKNLNSIFLEGKLLEEFFYDDFDRKNLFKIRIH